MWGDVARKNKWLGSIALAAHSTALLLPSPSPQPTPSSQLTPATAQAFISAYTSHGYARHVETCTIAGIPVPATVEDPAWLVTEVSKATLVALQALDGLPSSPH